MSHAPAMSVRCLLACAAVLAAPAHTHADDVPIAPLPVVEIAAGVHVHIGAQEIWSAGNAGDVANLGFVVGERCVAVIDSGGSPVVGRRLLAAVERTTPLPVCYVVNTHAHPDHMLGNAAFAALSPAPRFVAHERFAPALAARAAHYVAAVEREFGVTLPPEAIVYPDLAVEGELELELGGRSLRLRAWPTAHTDHDLSVHDSRTRTLFAGDLLFVGHLPVIDGHLRGWLEVIGELKALEVEIVVPGHGPVGHDWPGPLAAQETYLDFVLNGTRDAIRAGLTITRAIETLADRGTHGWLLAEEFHRRNLTAAYGELEWED